jgi:hypothetical protein
MTTTSLGASTATMTRAFTAAAVAKKSNKSINDKSCYDNSINRWIYSNDGIGTAAAGATKTTTTTMTRAFTATAVTSNNNSCCKEDQQEH